MVGPYGHPARLCGIEYTGIYAQRPLWMCIGGVDIHADDLAMWPQQEIRLDTFWPPLPNPHQIASQKAMSQGHSDQRVVKHLFASMRRRSLSPLPTNSPFAGEVLRHRGCGSVALEFRWERGPWMDHITTT
jgi:hypothetical protein